MTILSFGGGGAVPDPLYRWVPPYAETYGDLAAVVGEQLGMPMDAEQKDILDAIYAEDEPGVPACFEVGVVAPRQNLKTSTLEIAALTDVFVLGERSHVWTAHLFPTARKTFEHMVELIARNEDFKRRCVWPPPASHGEEAIELLTGEKIEFKARSKGGGRGFAGVAKVTLDEALFLSGSELGALLPTMATNPAAQVRYGSSAGFATSDALRDLRDRGRRGNDPRLAYIEFGAPAVDCEQDGCTHRLGTEGCALDREELWARANPALGRRIRLEFLRSMRRSLPAEEFAREFLSWWDEPDEEAAEDDPIDMDVWVQRRDPASAALDPVVVGLDVSPQRVATIAVAGWRADGRKHGEMLQTAPGTGWVIPFLLHIVDTHDPAALVVDGKGPASALLPEIRAAGLDSRVLSLAERAQADDGLASDIEQDQLRLPGPACPPLDGAAEAASWRFVGDVRLFDRKKGKAGISPMVSLSLARFGLLEVAAAPVKPPPAAPVAVPGEQLVSAGAMNVQTVGF